VSGVIVMMLMFGLVACGTTLLAEREGGTLRRLFVAAIDRRAVLLSKFLFCVVVGLLQLVLVFAVGELVFRVDTFRDPLTLAVLALTWTACATSFGMLIAAWAKTQKQAEGLSTLLILVMAAIGGCWFPVQIADLPLAAELVTRAMPTYCETAGTLPFGRWLALIGAAASRTSVSAIRGTPRSGDDQLLGDVGVPGHVLASARVLRVVDAGGVGSAVGAGGRRRRAGAVAVQAALCRGVRLAFTGPCRPRPRTPPPPTPAAPLHPTPSP
jgi:ABC-type transport system involved in cytochrome c biogenesis permease component